MLKRYFVKLSYKGTHYSGWQIQPNAHTIQAELQNNLTKLNGGNQIKIMGCGRTDAGVHSRNFFMHMDFPEIDDVQHLVFKLNHMLPKDIVIHGIYEMEEKAHTRFDAIERTYHYKVLLSKDPFMAEVAYHHFIKLDFDKMNEAAKLLLDYKDFESFSRVRTEVKTFLCDVRVAKWVKSENSYVFIISANRFLRNMVRAIVGTLIDVGEGKMTVDDFEEIIKLKDRTKAGKSASAHGLSLIEVLYPYKIE